MYKELIHRETIDKNCDLNLTLKCINYIPENYKDVYTLIKKEFQEFNENANNYPSYITDGICLCQIKISKYEYIDKLHTFLDAGPGHAYFGKLQSEALMIKYVPGLIKIKKLLEENFNIQLLNNIEKYPLDLDESLLKFYEKILFVLLYHKNKNYNLTRNQYFVQKCSMKFIKGYIFYEYVFNVSDDKKDKYNTFVCYSFKNINFCYDLKLVISKQEITFLNTKIIINVIDDYEYSIRPCAFKNILYLINIDVDYGPRDKGYDLLMKLIKEKNVSLVDIVDNNIDIGLNENNYYSKFLNNIKFFINKNCLGRNIIRFLLLDMRNYVIRSQRYYDYKNLEEFNKKFNNLRIAQGTLSFELMPFSFSPKNAKPSLYTLCELYNPSMHKDEIMYNFIDEYINRNNTLFIKPKDIGYGDEIFTQLKDEFNSKLRTINPYYIDHQIIEESGHYTIKYYYDMSKDIVEKSLKLSKKVNVDLNLDYSNNPILSERQKEILGSAFKNSSIMLIAGAAGSGKTTMIKEFIKNNDNKQILCLTTTNTANNNLKFIHSDYLVDYKNMAQFESDKYYDFYDIIIIDEASFVSASAINKILSVYNSSNILIVGDPEQIESIEFGNWFIILLELLKKDNVVKVIEEEHRSVNEALPKVWEEIRKGKKQDILEKLSNFKMTEKINDSIFNTKDGETVLCLNYDGLYGVNNINRYLQSTNDNIPYEYQQNLYKVDDPVVFITNDYDYLGIYNNLKGKIVKINDYEEKIIFKIKLFNIIRPKLNYLADGIMLIEDKGEYFAIIEKLKYFNDKYDEDMEISARLPFQIAYAMTIHKAQGLEFDNVKIVITKESQELISKNIFYTAVTRAKNKLKIYWEPEVANDVLNRIENSVRMQKVDTVFLKKNFFK